VARQLTLLWGTVPFLIRPVASSDQMVEEALRAAVESGLAREGDTVVVTFGVPVGVSGTTNLLQVHTIGGIAVRGHGLGGQVVTGPVRRIERLPDLRRTAPGDILVLRAADPAMAPYFERAAAVVAEEGGLTSPTAILGVSVGIPVIVGAEGALGVLREGETVTVDARRGIVYRGTPRL
jgi:pyruvate kinase